MNLPRFFEHWMITENPFRGEEARQDAVFRRLTDGAGDDGVANSGAHTTHSDFEKVAGEFDRPATSIVFGEKGSGKTAIRMQLAKRLRAYNAARDDGRCFLISYDDLNPILDRFVESVARITGRGNVDPTEAFKEFRLVDHIDAILSLVTPGIVDVVLNQRTNGEALDLGDEPRRSARKMSEQNRRDLLLLQAMYDRPANAEDRTKKLRRALKLPVPKSVLLWDLLAKSAWIIPLAAFIWGFFFAPTIGDDGSGMDIRGGLFVQIAVGVLALGYGVIAFKRFVIDRLKLSRVGRALAHQIRVVPRGEASFSKSVEQLDPAVRTTGMLPTTSSDDQRYAMMARLRRVLEPFGFKTMMIVLDRIDEPTLISGDPERMQHVVWPLLNNKFLQQERLGVKMLLPIELRHALYRESSAFFQEARLDKQNLIDRLSWTGAMLYDLCNARVQACRAPGSEPITLLSLFAEDVTAQDLIDALDQMHQPRDAFKLLYQCLVEHCSNVTEEQAQWRIPRLVLESVRKDQAERVRQLYRGVRPA